MTYARKRHWSEPSFRPMAVLALALFAYSASVLAGTNGFVAAFAAGIAFGTAFVAKATRRWSSQRKRARSCRSLSGSCSAP
jgi:NhaP-type Na+/H+ or K+/H+ antiporter